MKSLSVPKAVASAGSLVWTKSNTPWAERIPIGDVIEQLDFIKDKKHYGLYLRLSNRVIEEKDFSIVLGAK